MELFTSWLGGNCPVQGEGTIDGKAFYFRARGDSWSFTVAETQAQIFDAPLFYYEQDYGTGPYDAGWMEEEEAAIFIEEAAEKYLAQVDTHPKGGDSSEAPAPLGSAVPEGDAPKGDRP